MIIIIVYSNFSKSLGILEKIKIITTTIIIMTTTMTTLVEATDLTMIE